MRISIRKINSHGFDVSIEVADNATQYETMLSLDSLLNEDKNKAWLMEVFPWAVNYEIGISYRHFSGDLKEGQALIQRWIRELEKQLGKKNVSIEL